MNKETDLVYLSSLNSKFGKTQAMIIQLQQENKQLKDNWNKLKNIIQKQIDFPLSMEFKLFSKMVLKDMQELEKGDSNE